VCTGAIAVVSDRLIEQTVGMAADSIFELFLYTNPVRPFAPRSPSMETPIHPAAINRDAAGDRLSDAVSMATVRSKSNSWPPLAPQRAADLNRGSRYQ